MTLLKLLILANLPFYRIWVSWQIFTCRLVGGNPKRLAFKKDLFGWALKQAEQKVGKGNGATKLKDAVNFVKAELNLSSIYETSVKEILEERFKQDSNFINGMIQND